MNQDLLFTKNVIVQGITGVHGRFQAESMLTAGTNIIAGTSPGKAGQMVRNIPVYDSIADIQKDYKVNASVIFVPARFTKSAIIEAIEAKVPLIICVTEGVPVNDMIEVKRLLKKSSSVLIGPNSPGLIAPGVNKLGIIPADMSLEGHIALVSRSGTLTYETMASLTKRDLGQRYVIGIGGDPVRGIGFIECLQLFQADQEVDKIVLIGEIGGTDEQEAAEYISTSITKPVFAYVAGHHAPVGVQMGHAGAILGSTNESADAKTTALKNAGATTANSIGQLVDLVSCYTDNNEKD
jgi:succinyl-CoA synthetase alpha subunit